MPLLIPHWGNLQTKKPFLSSFNLHLVFDSLLCCNMFTVAPRNVVWSPYTVVLDSSTNPVIRDWVLEPFLDKRGPRTSGVSEADYTDTVYTHTRLPAHDQFPLFPGRQMSAGDSMRRSAVLHFCVLNNLLLHFYWSAIVSQDVFFFFLFCFDRVRACVFIIWSSGRLMSRPPASLHAAAVAGCFWWHAWKLLSCFMQEEEVAALCFVFQFNKA